jgi:hypothetical protein
VGTARRPSASAHWVSETRDERFSAVRRVRVEIASGRIEVGARRGPGVRVRTTRAETGWRARAARWRAPAVPAGACSDETLRLRADAGHVRVRIEVPAGTVVEAQVGDGDLTLWGVGGRLSLRVGKGVLAGRDLDADAVDAQNSHGEVNLHFVARPARVEARSATGPVVVVLPGGGYRVDVDVDTEVTVDLDDEATAEVVTRSGGRSAVLADIGSEPI